jgi:long-chain acyl-CoA synthetase
MTIPPAFTRPQSFGSLGGGARSLRPAGGRQGGPLHRLHGADNDLGGWRGGRPSPILMRAHLQEGLVEVGRSDTLTGMQSIVERLPTYGDRPAVGLRGMFGTWWWSYRELHSQIHRFAALLAAWGVGPGERVVIWAANGPEWVAAALGTMISGAILVPIDDAASPELVARLLERVEPAVVIVDATKLVDDATARCRRLDRCFREPAAPLRERPLPPLEPDAAAVILFTSGTTRAPRGVVLTHRNLSAQAKVFAGWRPLTRLVGPRMLALSPLSHAQGLLMGLTVPMSVGLQVLFSRSVEPAHVLRTVRHHRVNLLLAVPRVHRLLIRAIRDSPYRGSGLTVGERVQAVRSFPLRRHLLFLGSHGSFGYSLWVLLVGGATLPTEDERFWFDCGLIVVKGYGLTETTALVSLQVNGPFWWRPGSIGRPLSHAEVRLAPDGEVLVRGPSISPAFFGSDDGAAPAGTDGFLPTGDLARGDGRRRLRLLGRKKDVIVTAEGMNVLSSDVEAVLTELPGVRDAVVIEAPDQGLSRIHAVLLLDDTGPAAAQQVISHANRRLEAHQRISSWTTWPEPDFPRTSLAKVRRASVAATVKGLLAGEAAGNPLPAQASGAAQASPPTLAEIRQVGDRRRRLDLLGEHLLRSSTSEEDGHTTLVEDLGLSSLDVVELLATMERAVGFALDSVTVTPVDSVADVRSKLARPRDGGAARQPRPPRMDRALFRLSQRTLAPLVLSPWSASLARLTVVGRDRLQGLEPPFIVACGHHEHGADVLLLRRALPRRLRRHLFVVTTTWLFGEYLDSAVGATPYRRTVSATAFHAGLPMLLPFALWPSQQLTTSGLAETGRLIDRGYNPIVFPATRGLEHVDPGVGVVAEQTRAVVLPVWLDGNDGIDLRPAYRRRGVTVRFGAPLQPQPDEAAATVTARLRERMLALAGGG